MGEVVQLSDYQKTPPQDGGELGAHFESQVEVNNQVQGEVEDTHGFLIKNFPSLFMTPGEVIGFLESTRGRVEQIENQAV